MWDEFISDQSFRTWGPPTDEGDFRLMTVLVLNKIVFAYSHNSENPRIFRSATTKHGSTLDVGKVRGTPRAYRFNTPNPIYIKREHTPIELFCPFLPPKRVRLG